MQMTVAQLVRKKDFVFIDAPQVELPLPDVLMGVEVEIDQDSSSVVVFPEGYAPEWQRKTDGSLRRGFEYVLAAPLSGKSLIQAVYKLYSPPTQVCRTYTGSTHIHINMMDNVSTDALSTMVLMAYAFESVLYYAGDHTRQWCGFANRLTSAPSEVLEAIIGCSGATNWSQVFRKATDLAGRYYGLNLQALVKYGTIEFRYFPTAESADELIKWIRLVQTFKKAAIEVGTINNLIQMLSTKDGYKTFVSTYFSDFADIVEVAAEYQKVKGLMAKALIIATAQRRNSRTTWTTDNLQAKYGSVLAAKKVPRQRDRYTVKIVNAPRHQAAPSCQESVEAAKAELGENVIVLLLYPDGYLYYTRELPYSNGLSLYDWYNFADAPYDHIGWAGVMMDNLDLIRAAVESSDLDTSGRERAMRQITSLQTNYPRIVSETGVAGTVVSSIPYQEPRDFTAAESTSREIDPFEEEYNEPDYYEDEEEEDF